VRRVVSDTSPNNSIPGGCYNPVLLRFGAAFSPKGEKNFLVGPREKPLKCSELKMVLLGSFSLRSLVVLSQSAGSGIYLPV